MRPPDAHIPSKFAIVPYYIVAALAFVLTTSLCVVAAPAFAGHYFQPKLLAITHLAALGWATMIIFGASNQLVPVITEQKLHSEKLPITTLFFLIIGLALLVPSFWNFTFTSFSYIGGILLLVAFSIHAYNMFKTTRDAKVDIINDFMLTSHIWLLLTAVIGLMLLINLRYPFLPEDHLHYLKIHGSIGMAGWFLQLIIGVSSRLIPMFLLSRHEEKKLLNITYYAINISLILFLSEGMAFHSGFGRPFYFLILLSGLICYVIYIKKCYSSAMQKNMDFGMKQTLVALILISIPFILLSIQFFIKEAPGLIVAYGISFFIGFISTIIMGQTFKTLPFIVWMHITQPDKLPKVFPKDLFKEQLVKWQMLIFLFGYLLFLIGILTAKTTLLYPGAMIMTLAAVIYFIHVLFITRKLIIYAI